MTYRMAYTLSLPITAALTGAFVQYLMTGSGPTELLDYFFPKTGNKDDGGNDERVSLPSYMKDVYAYYKNIKTKGVRGLGQMLGHKASPMLAMAADIYGNKDFFGVEIANSEDQLVQQAFQYAQYIGKNMMPFSWQGYFKEKNRDATTAKKLMPFIGMPPAPAYVNQSDATILLHDLMGKYERPAISEYQFEHKKALREFRRDLWKAGPTPEHIEKVRQARREGKISDKEMHALSKQINVAPLERMFKSGLTLPDTLKVMDVATDREKIILADEYMTKWKNYLKNSPPEDIERYKKHADLIGQNIFHLLQKHDIHSKEQVNQLKHERP